MKPYKDWTLEEARLLCDDRRDRGLYCKGCELDGVCCENGLNGHQLKVPRHWRTDKLAFTEEEIAFAKMFQAACGNDIVFKRKDRTTLVWGCGDEFEHRLPYKLFLTIEPGREVWLKDILREV